MEAKSNSSSIPTRRVGTLDICPIINGLWSLGNGSVDTKSIGLDKLVDYMFEYSAVGLNTWDGADHYGPSEYAMGLHRLKNRSNKKQDIYFTKYVPDFDDEVAWKDIEYWVGRSKERMKTATIDLLQFHWWNFKDRRYVDAVKNLVHAQKIGRIHNLSLTNFPTSAMKHIFLECEKDNIKLKIASNQIPYSVIDNRCEKYMVPFCLKKDIKLLTYGTLLGGFLTDRFLGVKKPNLTEYKTVTFAEIDTYRPKDFSTEALNKYYPWIVAWSNNDWNLFQELLQTLKKIGNKYNASIAQIAIKYILDKPAVGGVIIGCRLGVRNHINDTLGIFKLNLTEDDKNLIQSVVNKGRPLYGEPGDEYRGSKL